MNLNKNSIPCPFKNHQERKIITICLNKECKQKRLSCLICNAEFHKAHPENLIEIDIFNSFIQQESNRQVEYPSSYTFGQCQLIKGFEELLAMIDSFQKLVKEQIEKIKNQNLQEYLKQQTNAQQGVQTWNLQIEYILQYYEVKNYLLCRKDQKYGELNETEKNSQIIIDKSKEGLKLIEESFHHSQWKKQFKFNSIPVKLEGHQNIVFGIAISSDGALMASSGYQDKTVKLWDVQKKQLIKTFDNELYGGVALSSNNQYLAYGGGGDHSIQLYDIKKNNNYATLMGHKNNIKTIVFSQDSQLLYSGGNDNKLLVWDISQKTQVHSFDTDSSIWTIVNSPDNKLISCICWHSINIWDYSTKTQLIHQKDPHKTRGYGLCSSKDSSMFISSGQDGLIKIWKLSDSENNQKSLKQTREIKAADNGIWKVILTPDEQYIVSICNVKTKIMIHEIESGNLIQELQYGDGKAQSYGNGYISISNDMNVLVSGGEDKTVKIWTRE